MAIEIETKDTTALSDAELSEMADICTDGPAGYDVGLLSLGALAGATTDELLAHCRAVADVMPLFGFYLQPAVGGRVLDYAFWRELAAIPARRS